MPPTKHMSSTRGSAIKGKGGPSQANPKLAYWNLPPVQLRIDLSEVELGKSGNKFSRFAHRFTCTVVEEVLSSTAAGSDQRTTGSSLTPSKLNPTALNPEAAFSMSKNCFSKSKGSPGPPPKYSQLWFFGTRDGERELVKLTELIRTYNARHFYGKESREDTSQNFSYQGDHHA